MCRRGSLVYKCFFVDLTEAGPLSGAEIAMSRIALLAQPRVRMAAAGLAVICVLAMAGELIGVPDSVLGQESLSDSFRREVNEPKTAASSPDLYRLTPSYRLTPCAAA